MIFCISILFSYDCLMHFMYDFNVKCNAKPLELKITIDWCEWVIPYINPMFFTRLYYSIHIFLFSVSLRNKLLLLRPGLHLFLRYNPQLAHSIQNEWKIISLAFNIHSHVIEQRKICKFEQMPVKQIICSSSDHAEMSAGTVCVRLTCLSLSRHYILPIEKLPKIQ